MRTRIEVSGDPDRPCCLLTRGSLAPRRLTTADGSVRVALVAAHALLLAGDEVRVELVVDGPHRVGVVETGGTVAYDMRGDRARWDVDVTLRGGAELAWHAEPFVVSRGADVSRSTTVRLDDDCRASLREVLVLGRTGEVGGSLRTSTRVTQGGRPVLAEDLDLAPDARGGPAILGGRRCLDTVTTVGHRLPDGPGVLQADAEASLARWLGDDLHLSDQPAVWAVASAVELRSSCGPRGGGSRVPEHGP